MSLSCEANPNLSPEKCNEFAAGQKLIEQRKQEVIRLESRMHAKEYQPSLPKDPGVKGKWEGGTGFRGMDPGFYDREGDRSNDHGIHQKPPTPSQAEIIQLGRTFLAVKEAARGAVLALNPSLASSDDPVRRFSADDTISKAEFFGSETAPYAKIAQAAQKALEQNPENKALEKFVNAYKAFSATENRMYSQYFHAAL